MMRMHPTGIAAILSLGAVVAALAAGDAPAGQALLAARWTARVALPLFLIVYLIGPVSRLWPGRVDPRWLRSRRDWGLAFAIAMGVHLIALAINVLGFAPRTLASVAGGGVAYVLLTAMAATSNTAMMRRMGPWWKRLHRTGIHVVWLVFLISYSSRIPRPGYEATGTIGAPLVAAAGLIRFAAWVRTRRRA